MLANDGEGTWYTAAEAVAAGLANEVGVRIANGSPPVAPDDEIDEDDDEYARPHRARPGDPRARRPRRRPRRLAGPAAHPAPGAPQAPDRVRGRVHPHRRRICRGIQRRAGSPPCGTRSRLPADADEAAIVAAVTTVVAESLEERPPSDSGVPEDHVVVPKAKIADLETGAAAGLKAAEKAPRDGARGLPRREQVQVRRHQPRRLGEGVRPRPRGHAQALRRGARPGPDQRDRPPGRRRQP
ncbi:hypothetical protein G5V59_26930 [Nocardioides sp. W3-2-3]|nr:hypothetical protein [Nocardioides convexus]